MGSGGTARHGGIDTDDCRKARPLRHHRLQPHQERAPEVGSSQPRRSRQGRPTTTRGRGRRPRGCTTARLGYAMMLTPTPGAATVGRKIPSDWPAKSLTVTTVQGDTRRVKHRGRDAASNSNGNCNDGALISVGSDDYTG